MQKDKKKEEIHGWGRGREKEGEKKGEEKEKVVEMQTDILKVYIGLLCSSPPPAW